MSTRNFILLLIVSGLTTLLSAQRVLDPSFDKKIDNLISYNVPIITISEATREGSSKFIFLDTRASEEYEVSHIPNARRVGYDDFDLSSVKDIPKDLPIVVYCSVGYRSDKIGGQLKKAGYTEVYNLYGSIFEWVNQGHIIVDINHQPTQQLHTYNKKWSRWVKHPEITKVW